MPNPTPDPAWRETTLLAVASPSEEASGPTRVLDPAGLPGTLHPPCRPSPPASRRHPSPVPTPPAARAGARRYRLLAPLGSGGMGTVYKAVDPVLGRFVAIKMLRRDRAGGDPLALAAEARRLARVDHPNVCKVYELGTAGDRPFIALQLVEGKPLRDVWRQLTLRRRVEVVLGVVEGLAEVHRQGLVHRDLKPANVVVRQGPGGRLSPCLVDFGIALESGSPCALVGGYLLGTPAYLAPEQACRGMPVDHRADLYSAGAMLYELACGRPPFGESSTAVRRHLAAEPAPPRRRAPAVPADLEAIILKCLEKNPDRRYPDASALAADLGRFLAGRPVSARRPGVTERLARAARRVRPLATAAAAAAALVLLLAGLWWSAAAEAAEGDRRVRCPQPCALTPGAAASGAAGGAGGGQGCLAPEQDAPAPLRRAGSSLLTCPSSLTILSMSADLTAEQPWIGRRQRRNRGSPR